MESYSNNIRFIANTVGMMDYIWPVRNQYLTEYDSLTYGIRKYTKIVKQGKFNDKLECNYLKGSILNCNNLSFPVVDSVQNIFTLLAKISKKPLKTIDAKWFAMIHEGKYYEARYLWAGVENLSIDNVDILCDHFRLDLEQVDVDSYYKLTSDYFTDHIILKDALRQIWVEQNNIRRIIKATVSIYGINVTAEIQYK